MVIQALVTGGAGFIGSNLVELLLNEEMTVRVLDDLSTGLRGNLNEFEDRIEWLEGDIRDSEVLKRAVDGVEWVFHQAALAAVSRSVMHPLETHDVNVRGTLQLLIAARDAQVSRVVLASSSSVYGMRDDQEPRLENDPPAPASPYAAQKLTCEHYARVFSGLYGLETVSLRYFNVYGPRQNPASDYAAVIPLFLSSGFSGKAMTINGDGLQTRDFTFVRDIARANLLAATQGEGVGEVINLGNGAPVSILDLAKRAGDITGSAVEPIHGPPREGDVKHSNANTTKARQILGWEAEVELNEGLKATAEWMESVGQ